MRQCFRIYIFPQSNDQKIRFEILKVKSIQKPKTQCVRGNMGKALTAAYLINTALSGFRTQCLYPVCPEILDKDKIFVPLIFKF